MEENTYEDKKIIAVKALAEIDPTKPYGVDLFNAIARVSISVAVELVALRNNAGTVEVLLTQRGPNEAYAYMWHCPGSVIRPGESEAQVFARLAQREFGAPVTVGEFVGYDNCPPEERGHFILLIFLCTPDNGSRGTWFSVDNLPETVVKNHKEVVIPKAVAAFLTGRH